MKNGLIPVAAVLSCLTVILPVRVGHQYGTRVDAAGHRLRVRVAGEGRPAVVFETFGVAPLEAWGRVQPRVAAFARTVAYDHAGFWGSDAGPRPRDARRIAGELHAALAAAGVPSPYVLV